jgi:hypothetical protein
MRIRGGLGVSATIGVDKLPVNGSRDLYLTPDPPQWRPRGGRWNATWEQFFANNPNASARRPMNDYNLTGPIVPYRG